LSRIQSGDYPLKYFSQIWLQTKHETKHLKTSFSIFLGILLEPRTEIWRLLIIKFGRIMAIENLPPKKDLILETSFYVFVCPTWTKYVEIWRFFLNFGRIMAIESLKKKFHFRDILLYFWVSYLNHVQKFDDFS
jgi:hypothetical protein